MTPPVLGAPESLLLLLLALALEAGVGDLRPFARLVPGPADLAFRVAAGLDRRLNRIDRSDAMRMIRGLVLTLVIVAAAVAVGWAAAGLARTTRFGWALETVLAMGGLSVRLPWSRAKAIAQALGAGRTDAAREAARALTFKNLFTLDDHGVARVAVEGLAKAVDQSVVAPLFWYALAGLPGLLGWTALNAVDAAIGHRSPRYAWFGVAAARLDDAANFLPARLSGLLVVVASLFVPRARPLGAIKAIAGFAGRHRSLSGGWPEAAFAGALGLALGGPRREGEVVVKDAWIGDGRARAVAADVRRALVLYALTVVLAAGLVAVLMGALALG